MHKIFHPSGDIDMLYVSRKAASSLAYNEDCVDVTIRRLVEYKKKSKE